MAEPITKMMPSRCEQIRQLALEGKTVHNKNPISSRRPRIIEAKSSEPSTSSVPESFLTTTHCTKIATAPSLGATVNEEAVEDNARENEELEEYELPYDVIDEQDMTLPASEGVVRTYEESDLEEPFQDSGSSYKPSEDEEISYASSDDLPLSTFSGRKTLSTPPKPVTKRSKKGSAQPMTWKGNKTKFLRMKGQGYQTHKKGTEGKSLVERKPRQMGEGCSSRKCAQSKSKRQCSSITDEERHLLFTRFWAEMDWKQRKTYVVATVNQSNTKQKTTQGISRRQTSFSYHLKCGEKLLQVCKKQYLATLGLGEWCVNNWVKKSCAGIPNITEKFPNKKKNVNEIRRQEIREFFEKLPKLPSHYCRASTSKLYLEPLFRSYAEVYEVYKKDVQIPTGKDVFMAEMKKLNIDIFQPRKDQCDVCFARKLGHVDDSTYTKHIDDKNRARDEKNKDKNDAIAGNVSAFTVDVQAVQLVPQLHAGMLYFKQKLACHNFTIYNLATNAVVCYVWHEGEGGMDSNCFASCIIDFLDNELSKEEKCKPIIFYSDGCAAQNRNALLSNVLLHYCNSNETEIIQKYLVKGHSQMECDSVHSTIESRKKNREIFSPSNYVQIIKDSRRRSSAGPYKVKYINHSFFSDFSEIKYYNSVRPGKKTGDACVTDIRALRYTKSNSIQYKLNFDEGWAPLPSRQLNSVGSVKKLYVHSLPIKSEKYYHLQALKTVIDDDYHPFYDALLHE